MTIYSRFGGEIKLLRPVESVEEAARLEGRKPDKHDEDRMAFGMYAVGRFADEEIERLFDLGMLKADDGIAEINDAARAVGCNPL